jgi:hypothetical protein
MTFTASLQVLGCATTLLGSYVGLRSPLAGVITRLIGTCCLAWWSVMVDAAPLFVMFAMEGSAPSPSQLPRYGCG